MTNSEEALDRIRRIATDSFMILGLVLVLAAEYPLH
jgi:hypothetical protein